MYRTLKIYIPVNWKKKQICAKSEIPVPPTGVPSRPSNVQIDFDFFVNFVKCFVNEMKFLKYSERKCIYFWEI